MGNVMWSDSAVWYFFLVVSLFWGMVSGSFATMLIYRLPRDIPLWAKKGKKSPYNRSFCTACNHVLRVKNLIPILSYLIQKGKCSYCGQKIASVYLVTECLALLLAILFYVAFGPVWTVIPVLLAVPLLVSLFMIDVEFRILPDSLNIGMAVLGLIYHSVGHHALIPFIISGVAYAACSYVLALLVGKVLDKAAMGMGDVKFFAVAGLWLGMPLLSQFLVLSGLIGVVFGAVYKKWTGNEAFPFGPALIISMIISFVFGELIFL